METIILIHYGEIALKGGNRAFFEKALVRNIQTVCKKICSCRVERISGRLLIRGFTKSESKGIMDSLQRVCGIVNFSLAQKTAQSVTKIAECILNNIKEKKFKTFKIDARRAGKHTSLSGQEVNGKVGDIIRKKTGAAVNLSSPELTCFVEIVEDAAYVYFEKEKGTGGLPAGVSGRVITLLSSGFDSPVAAYLLIKRGAENIFVHFHSYPSTSKVSQENVRALALRLLTHQLRVRLYLVPFVEIQKRIITKALPSLRLIFYRRAMMGIAGEIAKKEKAFALATGDSLGQVASQTLENIAAVSAATCFPVLRPCIGLDKEEIITISRKIGLYDISKLPYEDCCSFFVPDHPETRANLSQVVKQEKSLSLERPLKAALHDAIIEEFIY